ncbi:MULTISPECIES: type I DNA topoisomerase [Pseudomonas]|uniref:DNA topoisomerase 1 n=2 Tax=Pseudomonas TaxID=286 RepID=A0A2C5W5L9_PSEPU|nr:MULTISPECIES: type I DNA topoisomerase [Pseudomonas]MCO7626784.1 type I DNA topoisomerase [Pseudomonas fluorescens]PHH39853.1 DNA topoisomerase I [Pseudomonas putida]POA23046.1 type I DNA topoisomerase [Pseudomonas sp. FW305-3-2-15-E-TSA4]POA37643.1 type I DNA topoisomerase [Pseudomonas sp. FW305-3-2-15-E-TSA2]QBX42514.1 type I DNA topoisomerase [Pseudomonas fluorescens]
MGKSLVIVESPAKAKTINKYLGNQYVVKSSIGHIRDLPTSGSASASKEPAAKRGKAAAGEGPVLTPKEKARKQLVSRMGVDPEHGWKAQYEILPGKEKVIEELRRLAKDADTIYLATDLDREGEAIAWHLREAIGGDDSRYKRVVFNEITKKAIQEAFSEPGELDIDRVNAQQARRFLDRVVGYMVSPLLWAKIARGLSAGRVQSVAVKLVVEREREIRAFNPEEYWEVHADLGTAKGSTVRFEVAREKGEAFKPLNEAQATAALEKLKSSSYSIVKREDKPTSSKPSAPFITSTLQQAASNRLGFGVKKTMMMAQRLYEAGYITYMRTDSTNLSADAVAMARTYIEDEFGKKYLPETPNVYSSKEGAQEAHEAIRPSDANTTPSKLAGMERDAERLYELIWRQFLACQMLPAQYLSTTVSVAAGDFELRAKGRILKFDGYTRVLPQITKPGDDDVLPDMAQGDAMKLIKLDPSQHFTKPPARYSEASLVKEMEKRGIGRPSTYAAIISTIQDRGYVTLHNRRFYSEKMGDIVTERLSESFSNLMDYGFTAGMEENLDDVAQGERDWKNVLDEFYGDFKKKLEVAENPESGMRANQPVMTDIPCTTCGRPMQIRTASTGVFLGCSGYSLPPKERCKATVNLVPGDEIAADDEGESESLVLRGKHRCPICSTAMDAYLLDEKRKLHICGNNPDCAGYEIEEGNYRIKGYEGPSLECDKCGSEMQLKTGRFGKFFGCTNPTCKNTRKLLKSGDAAPPKMDPVKMPELKCEKVNDTYILRDGASGLFLAASQFPKNRETRAPLVIEILPHKDEIDPKYHFLCEAPQKDPDGLPAVIRYSRKTKEQYVQTEVDGKPTGWKAFYDGGKWTVEDKRTKAKAE